MKKITVMILSLLIMSSIYAQSAAELINQAKTLEKQRNETEALFKYKAALKLEPKNYEAIYGVTWLSGRVGYRLTDVNKKKEYFEEAMANAKIALDMKPNDADANYLMCFAYGRMAQISSSKQRVAMTKEIEIYGKKALAIDPDHVRANHAMGLLYYRLANLSAVEKAAANIVLGGLPSATTAQSVPYFVKAIKGDPTYILYRRDISFALIKLKQNDKAKEQLQKAVSLPVRTEDDPAYIMDCKALLSQL